MWTQYYPQDGRPYLVDSSGQEFTEFDYVSKRVQDESLSIFSLLVNANSKLQGAKRRADYPPGVETYITFVEVAITAIFFFPHGLQKQVSPELQKKILPGPQRKAPSPVLPAPSPLSRLHPTTPEPPTESRGDSVAGGEYSDLDIGFEDSDYYTEEDEEDNEPDTINGLTFPEMETVLQRVSDSTISDRERAEAAMLMLGMTGGELSLLCATLCSFRRRAPGPQALSPLIEGHV